MSVLRPWGPVVTAFSAVGVLGLAVAAVPAYGADQPVPWHSEYHPDWGCFGYCNRPLNPLPHPYVGCFGYCPHPPHPCRAYWGSFGYCDRINGVASSSSRSVDIREDPGG